MTVQIDALLIVDTAATLLARGLDIAQALKLPVASWRTGDPTRSLYKFLAEVLATRDEAAVEFMKGGYLSKATGDWLTVLALELYGVERGEATSSTPKVAVHNTGGGLYVVDARDLTFKSSASNATFHNTAGATIAAGATVTLELEADEPGSSGTVAVNEVDELVTALIGVEVVSSTAAIGLDAQDDPSLKQDCADTLGALSPDGPADAYEYVARSSKLTGVTTVNRSRAVDDDVNLFVDVYIAGPNGAVDGATVTAVQAAIEQWATPLCVKPTVASATNSTVAVTAQISGPNIPDDYVARLTTALQAHFAALPIADDASDYVRRSPLIAKIHDTLDLTNVVLSVPAADVAYAEGHVPVLGAITITVV